MVHDQVGTERGAQCTLVGPTGDGDDPGTRRLAQLDPGGAQPAGRRVHHEGLPARKRPRRNRARCEVWKVSTKAVASASSNCSGASNTETAGAMAYSAMPPRAVLVMATTRLPTQACAPSPAASTTPQTSMPRVKGGGVGTETRFPRHRSMSLKFNDAAPDLDPYFARAGLGSLDGAHRQDLSGPTVRGHLQGLHALPLIRKTIGVQCLTDSRGLPPTRSANAGRNQADSWRRISSG